MVLTVWLPAREITEKDLDAHMMTSMVGSPPVDILVRTSGVKRLSDYLVWQVCHRSASSSHSQMLSLVSVLRGYSNPVFRVLLA